MGRGAREMRDFGKRAARGDPRALRDIASGKVPLPKRSQISSDLKTRMAEGRRKSVEQRRTSGEPLRNINPDRKPGPKTLSPETKTKLAESRRTAVAQRRAEGRPAYKTQAQHEASRDKRLADNAARESKRRAAKRATGNRQKAASNAREANKKVTADRQARQQKFPKPKSVTQKELMKKAQPVTHKPNPKAPAKSIKQTKNANVVNKFFGGSKKVPKGVGGSKGFSGSKGGGGGIGNIFTSGTGRGAGKRRPGQ